MSVFIIAEAGSSHDNDLQKGYRLIEAAKECGADAVKFQWTSDPYKMASRRGLGRKAADMYAQYLYKQASQGWLESLKAHADKVGIEFMCTVYLIEDIATIAPLVKRFKVSAFEQTWDEFIEAHYEYRKEIVVSHNRYNTRYNACLKVKGSCTPLAKHLWCVSEYPTPIDRLLLKIIGTEHFDGFSDHTANVLTGAAAVAAGAKIVEAHIKLHDTDNGNPDYGHSLVADRNAECNLHEGEQNCGYESDYFGMYVHFIRQVERML